MHFIDIFILLTEVVKKNLTFKKLSFLFGFFFFGQLISYGKKVLFIAYEISEVSIKVNFLSFFFPAGKEGSLPPFGREGEGQNLTDERIAHILSEASHMMVKNSMSSSHHEDQNSHEEDSKSPMNCPSPMLAKENSLSRRLKKYENDDIPQEKVVRIYQEELAKLMGRGPGTVVCRILCR